MSTESGRLVTWLRPLLAYAVALTRDRDRAADLVQDCALRALTARRTPPEASYGSWLFRILRHCHVDQIRAARRRERLAVQVAIQAEDLPGSQTDPVTTLALREALSRLPSHQQEVVVLVDVLGYSYAEAARDLEVPYGTIMSRLARARRALLEQLDERGYEGVQDRWSAGG